MFARFRLAQKEYPRQFWLMFWGMVISTTGSSMVWPFLMIYVKQKLQLPLTQTASLLTINAVSGLIFSFIAGPIVDRLGRKWVMVLGMGINSLTYLFLGQATTYPVFVVLFAFTGIANPLYRVGADAMLADLIPSEKRPDAYALLRMSHNLGISIGPAIGGFIAAVSYARVFFAGCVSMGIYCLLLALLAVETLPAREAHVVTKHDGLRGYALVARDRKFLYFVAAYSFTGMCAMMMWTLLSVYTKQNFDISERLYGWIPTTNAIMVVVLQLFVTNVTRRYANLPVLAVGALFYAFGVGSVAIGQGFWAFWASMVVMTIGELIMMPTATTHVADLAPVDMRGRYMSIFNVTWSISAAVGPVLGGFLNDQISPASTWYGALVIGLISAALFFILTFSQRRVVMGKAEVLIKNPGSQE